MSKIKVLLLIQSGYSARNFFLSGFTDSTDFEYTIWSNQDYIEQYGMDHQLIKLPEYDYSTKTDFLQKVKNKAELFFNVKRTKNKNYLSYLQGIYKTSSFKKKLKSFLTSLMARRYASSSGILKLDQPFYKSVRTSNYYRKCVEQLKEEQPAIVFCTHQRASVAVAPMLAARDLGIKTVCFIHSWDNIPKGVQLIKADTYFVWSEYMKNEMIEHYPFVKPEQIKVTGTPQFVCYFDEEYRLRRENFLGQFNLDTTKEYILFSGNDKTTSPNDPVYLSDVCKAVQKLNQEKDRYHLLFRPNPIDRNEGFDSVLKEYKDILTEIKPDWFGSEVFLWNKGGPNKKDISLLVNTILHSELIINMGSTMALDSAILGKPACYINYDVESEYSWSVERTYRFIHFKMIKDINPVFWIKKREEVFSVLKHALENKDENKKGRQQWIERAIQLPINKTIPRMWSFLKEVYEV